MAKASATKPKEEKPKVRLTITQVKNDLALGIDRDGIAEKYGLTKGDVKKLFQHPSLKGLKVKTAPGFDLVDDTVEDDAEEVAETNSGQAEAVTDVAANKEEKAIPAAKEEEKTEPASQKKGVW